MSSAGQPTTRRRVAPWALGVLLIIAAVILGIMTAGFAIGFMSGGLSRTFMDADAPGVHELDAAPGSYDLTRARAARPDDAGTLTIRAEDPDSAFVSEAGPGSYIEIDGVRHDLLATVEKRTGEPVRIEFEGDGAHFPIVARRAQMAWMERVGLVTAFVALLPVGLFIAGIAVMVREKHRQTRELVDFVSEIR